MTQSPRMLEVKDLHYAYNAKRGEVLKGVDLAVGGGQIVCLLGSNGTGKTTLLRNILGFEKPKSGEILFDGRPAASMKARERARCMAYVPQSSGLAFPYKASEVVLMGRVSHLAPGAAHGERDRKAAMDALERLQVEHLANRRYQELSGGERQMVLVARALAQESRLLIMDEPTANLDYHNQVKILAAIKYLAGEGFGILMTSHYPDHAFLACSHVALLKGGRVTAYGRPDEVVTGESLTTLYETPVHVCDVDVGGVTIKTCIPLLDEHQFGAHGASHGRREEG